MPLKGIASLDLNTITLLSISFILLPISTPLQHQRLTLKDLPNSYIFSRTDLNVGARATSSTPTKEGHMCIIIAISKHIVPLIIYRQVYHSFIIYKALYKFFLRQFVENIIDEKQNFSHKFCSNHELIIIAFIISFNVVFFRSLMPLIKENK